MSADMDGIVAMVIRTGISQKVGWVSERVRMNGTFRVSIKERVRLNGSSRVS